MKKLLFFCLMTAVLTGLRAQDEEALLRSLVEEDRDAVEALVLYPEATRLAILEAARHPEALVRLESLQGQTQADFTALLTPYDREVQEMIWDLTRYPGLIERLVLEEQSGARIRAWLDDYPEIVRERAMRAGTEYYRLLLRIYELQDEADEAFEKLLDGYPVVAQEALRTLVELPEVLTILTENVRLTVLIGDLYERRPEWLLQKADSLSLAVAREQAQEYQDWQQGLEEDPAAKDELIASSRAFAEEYGYDDEYYDYDTADDLYYAEPDEMVIEHHYYYHYPYWWGYPRWYLYPRWRPLPWWYDWGFYFRPGGGGLVVIGLPSYYFVNWYFHYPHHHYYYPHLSSRFVGFYYGHRRSTGSIALGVSRWQERHREVLRDNWLADPGGRVERIREFGRLEKERLDFNRRYPGRELSTPEYLQRNPTRYPRLREEVEPAAPRDPQREIERRPAPRPEIPSRTKPAPRLERPERSSSPRPPRPAPSREEIQRIEKAREHHQQQWERKSEPPRRQRIEPAPRRAPATTPRKTEPRRSTKKKQKGNG